MVKQFTAEVVLSDSTLSLAASQIADSTKNTNVNGP